MNTKIDPVSDSSEVPEFSPSTTYATVYADSVTAMEEESINGKDGLSLAVALVENAFLNATMLIQERSKKSVFGFIASQCWLHASLEKLKTASIDLSDWPKSPVFFGQYHLTGRSAYGTAYMFADHVLRTIEESRESLFGSTNIDSMFVADLAGWMELSFRTIESKVVDLSSWPKQMFTRDVNVLCSQLTDELSKVLSKRPAFFDSLTLDNQQLLEAMMRFETGATLKDLYDSEPKAWKDIPQPGSLYKRLSELQAEVPISLLSFKPSKAKGGSFTWIKKNFD
jgi:hypothetical protein